MPILCHSKTCSRCGAAVPSVGRGKQTSTMGVDQNFIPEKAVAKLVSRAAAAAAVGGSCLEIKEKACSDSYYVNCRKRIIPHISVKFFGFSKTMVVDQKCVQTSMESTGSAGEGVTVVNGRVQ